MYLVETFPKRKRGTKHSCACISNPVLTLCHLYVLDTPTGYSKTITTLCYYFMNIILGRSINDDADDGDGDDADDCGDDDDDGADDAQVALNVPRDASSSDIKKAYRKQALVWHPDKNVSLPGSNRKQALACACCTNTLRTIHTLPGIVF